MIAPTSAKVIVVALFVICSACDRTANRASERGRTTHGVLCDSSGYMAARLGYSLALSRSARKFSTRESQRLSLARLEPLLVSLVQLEPDSTIRSDAWKRAADSGIAEGASYKLEDVFERAHEVERRDGAKSARQYLDESYEYFYHDRLEEVVKFLSPENVDACRQQVWQKAYAAALDAAARGAP